MKTLKDMDFIQQEQTLKISPSKINKLLNIIRNDVHFLYSHGLMDYSLLIIIIDKEKVSLEISNSPKSDLQQYLINISHYSQVYQSTEAPNYLYIIGIIDYLQSYTHKKQMEKYFKNFMRGSIRSVDTSSQDPEIYKNRFLEMVYRILGQQKLLDSFIQTN